MSNMSQYCEDNLLFFTINDDSFIVLTKEYDYLFTIKSYCDADSCICSSSYMDYINWDSLIKFRKKAFELSDADELFNNSYKSFTYSEELEF